MERVGQIRGVVAERVVISTALDPFLSLRALADYSGLSVKTLRSYIDRLPHEALPAYRVGHKVLVRRSEFDAWMAQFRAKGRPGLAKAIRDMGLGHTSA